MEKNEKKDSKKKWNQKQKGNVIWGAILTVLAVGGAIVEANSKKGSNKA